ncbi:MAG TPA: PadR family transcriptional regulator [Candidatus Methylomirabilis sp.]|nr:PadR family transcriptional regulator [Candidatus Methylomirabilis sp.]
MDIQLKKGVLELCVLKLLEKRDWYGYELVSEISKTIVIAEGTIYPLLRRVKEDGYVTTYLKESTEGPPRKYYNLTPRGHEVCKQLQSEWLDFSMKINKFISVGDTNE